MKHAQVISLIDESVLAFSGDGVINHDDQEPLAGAPHNKTSIQVDVNFFDLTSGSAVATVVNAEMVYQSASDHWTILLTGEGTPDIKSSLLDRHKYVGQVVENGGAANMRPFKISDFAVDNDSFEFVWMRYPYEVEVGGGQAWIRWYAPGDIGGVVLYEAPAYEGGTGTTYATAPNRVTHRGAIVPV